jgi:hypothetical protein
MNTKLVKCTQCNGMKQLSSLGGMYHDCSLCKGTGFNHIQLLDPELVNEMHIARMEHNSKYEGVMKRRELKQRLKKEGKL